MDAQGPIRWIRRPWKSKHLHHLFSNSQEENTKEIADPSRAGFRYRRRRCETEELLTRTETNKRKWNEPNTTHTTPNTPTDAKKIRGLIGDGSKERSVDVVNSKLRFPFRVLVQRFLGLLVNRVWFGSAGFAMRTSFRFVQLAVM
ncbi:unnamed protein product [Lathyrus oleraceus]